jgi:hypothetical protein
MYKNSRKILIVLISSWGLVAVVNIVSVLHWTNSFSETLTSPSTIPGASVCSVTEENKTGLVNYAFLLAGETVIVALTIYKGYQNYKNSSLLKSTLNHQMISTFYRDGVLFYLFIFPITFGNVLVLSLAPPELQVLETPLRVLHSIFCCRLVVHLREVAQGQDEDIKTVEELSFRRTVTDSESEV